MKTKKAVLASLCIALCIAVNSSCNHENMSRVTLYFGTDEQTINMPQKSFFNKIVSFFVNEAIAKGQPWTETRDSVTLTITGDGMEQITVTLPPTVSSYTVELPAGKARLFTILGKNSAGYINWGGHVLTDLEAGDVNLTIRAFPIPNADMFNFFSVSGPPLDVYIPEVTGSSVFTSYNLYKSGFAEGPFIKIYTGTNRLYIDSAVLSGITYHYRASINTTYGEGELSDVVSHTVL